MLKHKIKFYKSNNGYAILFTVAVVSAISLITIGLTNGAYNQLILSSVARDSTSAFYEADIASECALYADDMGYYDSYVSGSTINCGGDTLTFAKSGPVGGVTTYSFTPSNSNPSEKCFYIDITKTAGSDAIVTVIDSKGYNICNKNNTRTVERAIRISY